uniref:SET domain-containing protein n=1 Tax=Grammatophora oceanica TaxID=210454 RepID=A0A7S1YJJ5_9STRA|mmetsp:Transcript_50069/g.74753  ORF Transcript_50069/g.74753 Transcript_50069/m.74753 type:complete len:429 (+) Transcript_50069:94-1380(+)|eukprot:CAMPEP_0194069094 /NCGR_PEP_ID=MMETSP0009_2-20130614/87453_1 /TAXON_ID=210454 /ORGANISM="Grammatophora oceanica, Strain CCMP 410" /LENGTH=428 /DNA_ID=CAMNT_0038722255 /DNA_START=56 /DNA_END=1342 /DNA_ORIENTATION=-
MTTKMRRILLQAILLVCLVLTILSHPLCERACAGEIEVVGNDEEDNIEPLITWLKQRNGAFSHKIEVRKIPAGSGSTRYGIFAKQDLVEDEELVVIPREAMLTAERRRRSTTSSGLQASDTTVPLWCDTVRALSKEMKLGSESNYSAYVEYLNAQPFDQIPTSWSDKGKELLLELLGQNQQDKRLHFPPIDPVDFLEVEWEQFCKGSRDDMIERKAAILHQARGWDEFMVPVFDMMSHRNGPRWLNTKSNSVIRDLGSPSVNVTASRDIKAGEEIYNTYSHCIDCGNRKLNYGTPEILRDYGFVENYPQRWILTRTFRFEIDEVFEHDEAHSNNIEHPTGALKIRWLSGGRPSNATMLVVHQHLERLRGADTAGSLFRTLAASGVVPRNELDMILGYRRAAIVALEHALDFLGFTVARELAPGIRIIQ